MSDSGVGVTKPISSVPSFSWLFVIVKIVVTYWIPRSYLTDVTAAQLRWHLSNMKVIEITWLIFSKIKLTNGASVTTTLDPVVGKGDYLKYHQFEQNWLYIRLSDVVVGQMSEVPGGHVYLRPIHLNVHSATLWDPKRGFVIFQFVETLR